MAEDTLTLLLADRLYLYQLFQLAFGTEPSSEQISKICNQTTIDAFKLYLADDDNSGTCGNDGSGANDGRGASNDGSGNANDGSGASPALREFEELCRNGQDISFENLKIQYTKLFLGPEPAYAPAWESVYISSEPLLFQKATLIVRKFYQDHGFMAAGYPHVADDHLGIELDFMANLALKSLDCHNSSNEEQSLYWLKISQQFISEHLLKWLPKYVKALTRVDYSKYYNTMAELLLNFIKTDFSIIDEYILSQE